MKKIIISILSVVMVLSSATASVLAYSHKNTDTKATVNCVDIDNDDVCDNKSTNNATCNGNRANFVDTDKDGVCDNKGTNSATCNGNRANCVDADKDGVCDNKGTNNATCNGNKSENKRNGKCKGCC